MALLLLQPAINFGLAEESFWDMTLAEIQRYIEGATWRLKSKAQMDYALANLIGMSVGRLFDNKASMPSIEEVYPTLFEIEKAKEEPKEDDIMLKSQNRFMEWALRHNARKREEA